MSVSERCRKAHLPACLLIAAFVASSAFGQENGRDDPFSPVPAASRARLIERLNSFVESYRTKQWGKHYEMLDEDALGGASKDDYVKGRIETAEEDEALTSFRPQAVAYDEPFKRWKIEGCGAWLKQGNVKVVIGAYLRDGEWYFSQIGVELFWEKVGDSAWRADSRNTVPCRAQGG